MIWKKLWVANAVLSPFTPEFKAEIAKIATPFSLRENTDPIAPFPRFSAREKKLKAISMANCDGYYRQLDLQEHIECRKIVGRQVYEEESSALAGDVLHDLCQREGIQPKPLDILYARFD